MIYRLYLIDSLDDINPAEIAGENVYVQLPNGEIYEPLPGDQLGGFWSSLLGIAAPFASLIPGVGPLVTAGLSAASGALASKGSSNKFSKFDTQLQNFNANFDTILDKLNKGEISGTDALSQLKANYDAWQDFKMPQPKEEDRNYLYFDIELPIFKPKWDAITAKAEQMKVLEDQQKAIQEQQLANELENADKPFGLSYTELAIGGLVLFLFLRS